MVYDSGNVLSSNLSEICARLNDQGMPPASKLEIIKHTWANLREILWTNTQGKTQRAAQDVFEVLVDCLIFFILKYTNLKSQQGVSKLEEQSS